jgi:hypothetical protein
MDLLFVLMLSKVCSETGLRDKDRESILISPKSLAENYREFIEASI